MGRKSRKKQSREGARGLTPTLRRIRRRRLIDLGLRRCGRSLAVALALATAVLLLDRLFGTRLPLIVYVTIAVAGLLVGVIRTVRSAPKPSRVAIDIDRRLRLKDRLGTALALAHGVPASDPQFAEMVRRDAEGRAARIDPRSSAPIRLRRAWILVVALAALWPAAAQWLPARLLPRTEIVAAAEQTVEQAEMRQDVAQTLEQATSPLREQPPSDPIVTEQLEALDQLAEQLEADPTRPVDEIREESAARMDELAERLAEDAQRNLEATEQVTRRFGSMPEVEAPMSTDELLEAMRRGDFGDAADALDELLSRGDELSPAQRRRLAEALRELGRVAETPPGGEPGLDEPSARLRQTLRDQGLDEQTIDELMNDSATNARSLEQALAERGIDREVARDLARDLESLNEGEQVRRETQDQAESIRDAMNDAADRLEDSSSEPSDGQPPAQPTPPDGQQKSQPQPTETPDGQPQSEPTQTPDGQPRPQPTQTPNGQPKPQPTQTPDGQPQSQPTQTPDGQPKPQPSQAPDGQPKPQPTQTPDGQPQTPPSQTPDGQPKPQPTQTPDGQPQTPPSQTPDGQPKPQPTQTPDGQPKPQPTQTPDGQPQPQPSQTPDGPPQPQPSQTPDGQPQPQPTQTPDGQPQPQPTQTPDGQPQSQPTQTPDGQPKPQPTETPDGQPQPQPTQTPDGQPQPQPTQTPNGQQQPQPTQTPDGQQPQPTQTPDGRTAPDAGTTPSPAESLRELARRRSESRDRMRQSETLRDAARRMANRDEPWARDPSAGGEPGTAAVDTPPADADPLPRPDVEDLDISGERTDGETAARWLTDEHDMDAPTRADARRTRIVRDAKQVAERAVNESAVPKRYHRLIRRYFDRLQETVDRAAQSPPPPDER